MKKEAFNFLLIILTLSIPLTLQCSNDTLIQTDEMLSESKSNKYNCPENMVLIKPSKFIMGNDNELDVLYPTDKESSKAYPFPYNPAVEIILDYHYCIDSHEVTQNEYYQETGLNPSIFKKCGKNCPVENVTWNAAKQYCNSIDKRLPTESEWELSVRGNLNSRYYWGDEIDDKYIWYLDNSELTTHEVMTKRPTSNGIYDLLGNVWEWVDDSYEKDVYLKIKDGTISNKNYHNTNDYQYKVIRGGGFASNESLCAICMYGRYTKHVETQDREIGFRCVADPIITNEK